MFDVTCDKVDVPKARLLLAHGAGAGKTSPFMQDITKLLTRHHIEVIRFNFPYMQVMEATGIRRPPEKIDKLQMHFVYLYEEIAKELSPLPTFLGGKSMGGRVATLALEQTKAEGAVVFGYPFHPPAKPEKLRTAHLESMTRPVKIIQGSRDPFGTAEECSKYILAPAVSVVFLSDGDHNLKPRKASGLTYLQHLEKAANLAADFILSR